MVSMNRLSKEDRIRVVSCLVEGNSIRSTVRMTGISKNTISKLLVELGAACSKYQDEAFRNLKLNRIQCDEIWAFVYAKQKNVTVEMLEDRHAGDAWTWTAIDAETKLIPCWMIGQRDASTAKAFIDDLASRLATRVQITSDGLKVYLNAIEGAFGGEVDYAMLVKVYGEPTDGQKRYSPADCLGCKKEAKIGNPDPKHISTSYIERSNLTLRMGMRRFTRLTNGFSKKMENHAAAVALFMMYYNFARIHQTLRTSPAMATGVTSKLWSIGDIVGLLERK